MYEFSSKTGHERTFERDEIIVSKTNLTGHITYANQVFCRVAEFEESELLGKPHSIIRHPSMPRCVFKFLWDTIADGREVFAYVINRTKYDNYYWVFAHVTPTFDTRGKIVGYHSNRRVPDRSVLAKIKPLYKTLLDVESRYRTPKEQWQGSMKVLLDYLSQNGVSYEELIFSLCNQDQAETSRQEATATAAI